MPSTLGRALASLPEPVRSLVGRATPTIRTVVRDWVPGMYLRLRMPQLTRAVPIRDATTKDLSTVDGYWTDYTVNSFPFDSAKRSLAYLDWRFRAYPLFRELSGLYGAHDDQVVLDYGCGPGNDVVGHLVYSNARKIIGVDVSRTALQLTSHRLGLHREYDVSRVELIHKSEVDSSVPVPDASVDYISCQGVLMCTTDPVGILREFHRALRPGGRANIMVYHADSIRKHLTVAYETQILKGLYPGLSLDDAFEKCTDGESCPLVRNYGPVEFGAMCREAGFTGVEFVGGYLSDTELESYAQHAAQARDDERLGADSRAFLRELTADNRGYPIYRGKYAGSGGVYFLSR